MRQAAHYDLHTTEGLAQVQHLRFVLPSGEVDTQYNGMTVRGGVLDDGIRDMPGSEVIDGRCALQLPRLAAGCHRYDVLVSDNGTDKPLLAGVIHVAPRVTPVDVDDNAPADYLDLVIPEDEGGTITVISESPVWVDDAVEQSLQARGMYVTPVSGAATVSPPSYDQDQAVAWSWARFRFGDDLLGGYVGSVCKVRDVYVWAVVGTTDTTPRWLDVWRRAPGGDWVLAARSTQAVASSPDVDLYMWEMIADTEIIIGDEVALHVYGGTPEAPIELPLSIARQMVTAADGRGIAESLDGPITDATVMPAMMLSCTYNDGVRVGGVDLATRAEVDRTKDYVSNASKEVYASARQVSGDADQVAADKQAVEAARAALVQDIAAAQAILDAIPQVDAGGNMTLAGGLTTAAAINANGGINIPLPPPTPTHAARLVDVQRSALMSINYYSPTKDLVSARLGTVKDNLQGLLFAAPGSPVRGISAVSIQTSTTSWAQVKPGIIKITLTFHHWGSTMICVSNKLDIIDSTDGPLLSSGAIAQLSINETDANDAYTIYDAAGTSAVQGTLPRSLKGHEAVVDYYVLVYRDRVYFYQGATWTNRESQLPGSSTDEPVYLGHVPRNNMGGTIALVVAKGANGHQWGSLPAGRLHSITEFRLPDASEFFPHLND